MLLDYPVTENITFVPIHTAEFNPLDSEVPENWSKKEYIIQSYDNNYLGTKNLYILTYIYSF